jgi:hypothetical protein
MNLQGNFGAGHFKRFDDDITSTDFGFRVIDSSQTIWHTANIPNDPEYAAQFSRTEFGATGSVTISTDTSNKSKIKTSKNLKSLDSFDNVKLRVSLLPAQYLVDSILRLEKRGEYEFCKWYMKTMMDSGYGDELKLLLELSELHDQLKIPLHPDFKVDLSKFTDISKDTTKTFKIRLSKYGVEHSFYTVATLNKFYNTEDDIGWKTPLTRDEVIDIVNNRWSAYWFLVKNFFGIS